MALGFAAVTSCAAAAGLTSAPIDETLYREGEVRHLTGTFGRWVVACAEVTRLRQRYCSLRTVAADGAGRSLAKLTVSTGDDGHPAGLLELPVGTLMAAGVEVRLDADEGRARQARRASRPHTLGVVQCDAGRCYAVWMFKDQELAALNAGKRMRLVYRRLQAVDPFPARLARLRGEAIEVEIPTQGFSAAVTASIDGK